MIRDAANENADRTLSLLRTLRGFRVDATWPEHRHVLEEALPYLKKRDRAILLELRDDMTDGEEAARLLGVSFGSLADMNRKGLLPAQGMTGEQRLHAVFSRATLCELRSPLRDRAVLGRGAERVGVSVHGIEQLICSGAITTVSDPLVQRLYQAVQISKASVDRLVGRIESGQGLGTSETDCVLLRHVLKRIGGRDKPWGTIISALFDGIVPYGIATGNGSPVPRIFLRACDVANLPLTTFNEADHAFPFSTTMTRRDAQQVLNLQPKQMGRALRNELRQAIMPNGDLLRDQIMQTARLRISAGEVLARWGSGRRLPKPLLDDISFPRLGATGWDRRDVERGLGPDRS
ncbi:hypothetical protein [Sphingomonas sp. SAFR-052]|uniref:hypothetical protein n=1 Tax=Sphingomonas sp. SAFR-052 TaxID=3436867 RepID=UPI003F803D93